MKTRDMIALAAFLGNSSIYDVGAGVGQLGVLLKKKQSDVDYMGFDGGDNIQDIWGQHTPVRGDPSHVIPEVCWIDASTAVTVTPRDWVVSFEVGEHIPAAKEGVFIDNLVGMCTKGVVLSWAVKGQKVPILHSRWLRSRIVFTTNTPSC